MDSILGRKFTELGQVKAYKSDPNSTELTVRIESTSLFQVETEYELPEVDPDYVARNDDLQVIQAPSSITKVKRLFQNLSPLA